MTLRGELVALEPCTNALWHEFYRNYVPDPMMDDTPYEYDFDRAEKAFFAKTADRTRLYFFVTRGGSVVGQIYLKRIDQNAGTAEFGVALVDDTVKGRGFGTEAIRLLVGYAFGTLGLDAVLADSVLRNARSQHVLEKTGFVYTHEDEVLKYYRLEKPSNRTPI